LRGAKEGVSVGRGAQNRFGANAPAGTASAIFDENLLTPAKRQSRSAVPPAGNGTTMVIGRFGKSACAVGIARSAATSVAARELFANML